MSPGDSCTIDAMVNSEGMVTTAPEEIAAILKSHWKGVFSTRRVDCTALQIWMEDLFVKNEEGLFITGLPAGTDARWTIKRSISAGALKPPPTQCWALMASPRPHTRTGALSLPIFYSKSPKPCAEKIVKHNLDMLMLTAHLVATASITPSFDASPKK